jgi:hypothetical protein
VCVNSARAEPDRAGASAEAGRGEIGEYCMGESVPPRYLRRCGIRHLRSILASLRKTRLWTTTSASARGFSRVSA